MTQPLAQLPAGAAEVNSSPTISVSLEELPALATEVHHVAGEYRQSISPLQSAERHGGTLTQVYIGQQASSSLAQVLRDLQWIEQDMEQTSKNVYANYAGYTDADQKNARDMAADAKALENPRVPLAQPKDYKDAEDKYWQGYTVSNYADDLHEEFENNPETAWPMLARRLESEGYTEEDARELAKGYAEGYQRKLHDQKNENLKAEDLPSAPPQNVGEVAQRMNDANNRSQDKDRENNDPAHRGYSKVEVQVYQDPDTGQRLVYVYIPGTDFSHVGGEPGSAAANAALGGIRPETSLADSPEYMQQVDEALKAQGIDQWDKSSYSMNLVGHSQGGAIAYSAANNDEFNERYSVNQVITFGAPVQNLPDRGNKTFKVTQVRDWRDPVPGLINGERWQAREGDSVIQTDWNATRGNEGSNVVPHDMHLYAQTASQVPAGKQKVNGADGNYKVQSGSVYTASADSGNITSEAGKAGIAAGELGRGKREMYANNRDLGQLNILAWGVKTGVSEAADTIRQSGVVGPAFSRHR